MTPNNEVKAKLFSLYWGIPVLVDVDNSGKEQLYPIEQSNMYRIEESHLLLRSIESLTDEQARVITDLSDYIGDHRIFKNSVLQRRIDNNSLSTIGNDYLRSIGIALPITYLDENHKPVTANVSDLVEWGWVKLTTNK